jgi:hypothetical protein
MKARLAAAALVAALPATLLGVSPAAAASSGPSIGHLQFRWIPGTGSVHATAVVSCARGVTHAKVTIELAQSGAGARASTKLRCDGHTRRVHLLLDPNRGRFHPGMSGASWSTMGCRDDVCSGGIADGFAQIDRPGKARGPMGAR